MDGGEGTQVHLSDHQEKASHLVYPQVKTNYVNELLGEGSTAQLPMHSCLDTEKRRTGLAQAFFT